MAAGMKTAADAAKEKYGVTINTRIIGPAQTDPVTQISQIQQAVAAGQADCLSFEPVPPDAFVNVINSAATSGVPPFTANTDSPQAHRFAYYGPHDIHLQRPNQLVITPSTYVVH